MAPERNPRFPHHDTILICSSRNTWTRVWQPKVKTHDSRINLSMFLVSGGLMINTEKQRSMTALLGLYSALKQFPFLCVHLDQFI